VAQALSPEFKLQSNQEEKEKKRERRRKENTGHEWLIEIYFKT
jgi:hypothetical protein